MADQPDGQNEGHANSLVQSLIEESALADTGGYTHVDDLEFVFFFYTAGSQCFSCRRALDVKYFFSSVFFFLFQMIIFSSSGAAAPNSIIFKKNKTKKKSPKHLQKENI